MPKVSVIIPSFNHEKYIREAVTSVLNQSMTDLELIVVDDGSQDKSVSLLTAFSDPRMKIIQQANQGAHAALNRGLSLAKGQYLTILNSDDIFALHRLQRLVNYMDENPNLGFIGTYIEIIDAQGRKQGTKHGYRDLSPWPLAHPEKSFRAGDDLVDALLTENYFATTSNFFFRSEVWKETGDFKPLRYVHDWDFALRVAKDYEIELLAEPLLQYRIHATNTIRENKAAMIFEILWVLAVHLPPFMDEKTCFPHRTERLLHSIYTFENDRILATLLLQKLSENPEKALDLLSPENEERIIYLDFIRENMPVSTQNRTIFKILGDTIQKIRRTFPYFK